MLDIVEILDGEIRPAHAARPAGSATSPTHPCARRGEIWDEPCGS